MDVLPNEIIAIIFHLVEKDWRTLSILSKRMRKIAMEEIVPAGMLSWLLGSQEYEDAESLLRYKPHEITFDVTILLNLETRATEFVRKHAQLEHLLNEAFRKQAIAAGKFDLVVPMTTREYWEHLRVIPLRTRSRIRSTLVKQPIVLALLLSTCGAWNIMTSPSDATSKKFAISIYEGGCGFGWINENFDAWWVYCRCYLNGVMGLPQLSHIIDITLELLGCSTNDPAPALSIVVPLLKGLSSEQVARFRVCRRWAADAVFWNAEIRRSALEGDMLLERNRSAHYFRLILDSKLELDIVPTALEFDFEMLGRAMPDLTIERAKTLGAIPGMRTMDNAVCRLLLDAGRIDLLGAYLSSRI